MCLPVIMEKSVSTHLNRQCDFLNCVCAVWGLLKAAGGRKAAQQGKSSHMSLGRCKDQTPLFQPTHFNDSVVQSLPLQWRSNHTAGSLEWNLREGGGILKSFSTLCHHSLQHSHRIPGGSYSLAPCGLRCAHWTPQQRLNSDASSYLVGLVVWAVMAKPSAVGWFYLGWANEGQSTLLFPIRLGHRGLYHHWLLVWQHTLAISPVPSARLLPYL